MALRLKVDVFRGDEPVASHALERDLIKIGRLPSSTLRIDDPAAAGLHAAITLDTSRQVTLMDMGSSRGTFVNGQRVDRHTVSPGDEIRIGETRIVVREVHRGFMHAMAASRTPRAATTADPAAARQHPAVADADRLRHAERLAPQAATRPEVQPRRNDPRPAPLEARSGTQRASSNVGPVGPGTAGMVSPAHPRTTPTRPMSPGRAGSTLRTSATAQRHPPTNVDATPGPTPAPSAQAPGSPSAIAAQPAFASASNAALAHKPDLWSGRDRTLRLEEKPFGTYRPQHVERPPTSAAEGNVGLQIRFYWGDQPIHISQHAPPQPVYVGSTPRCTAFAAEEDIGAVEHLLVEPSPDGADLNLVAGMHGELMRGGAVVELRPGTTTLAPGESAWIAFGSLRAELSYQWQPPHVSRAVRAWDFRFLNLVLLAGFAALAFAITARTHEAVDLVEDDFRDTTLQYVRSIVRAAPPKPASPVESLTVGEDEARPRKVPARHAGKEGKAGRKDVSPEKKGRGAPEAISIDAERLVRDSGLLSSLKSQTRGLASVFGPPGLGGELRGALGGLTGSKPGDAHGFGGLGLRGTGPGGGGSSTRTIGIGSIDTGSLVKDWSKALPGVKKKSVEPRITDAPLQTTGSVDKELVRQVIRSHIAQVRYCYESALQSEPDLSGRLVVRFVIDQGGLVPRASIAEGSSIRNDRLNRCMLSRVQSWKFPAPKGGGSALVTYPFILRPAGE